MDWGKALFLIGGLVMAWLLYRQIKGNPQAFSRENGSKSLYTLAILALILIAFIGLLVLMLRSG